MNHETMIARVDLHIGEDLARSQIAIDGVSCPCQEIKIDLLNGRLPIVTLIGLAVEGQDIAGVASYEASPLVIHTEFPMVIPRGEHSYYEHPRTVDEPACHGDLPYCRDANGKCSECRHPWNGPFCEKEVG